jgi:hypothetical protein
MGWGDGREPGSEADRQAVQTVRRVRLKMCEMGPVPPGQTTPHVKVQGCRSTRRRGRGRTSRQRSGTTPGSMGRAAAAPAATAAPQVGRPLPLARTSARSTGRAAAAPAATAARPGDRPPLQHRTSSRPKGRVAAAPAATAARASGRRLLHSSTSPRHALNGATADATLVVGRLPREPRPPVPLSLNRACPQGCPGASLSPARACAALPSTRVVGGGNRATCPVEFGAPNPTAPRANPGL